MTRARAMCVYTDVIYIPRSVDDTRFLLLPLCIYVRVFLALCVLIREHLRGLIIPIAFRTRIIEISVRKGDGSYCRSFFFLQLEAEKKSWL